MQIQSMSFVKGVRGTDPVFQDGIPQIAFVGRSNVGKSSLINALTKTKDMAREGDKPGKTTEINFYLLNNKKYLVDLPGYGYARVSTKDREKLRNLIVWYLSESGGIILRVALIIDAVAGLTEFDLGMLQILRAEKRPFVVVVNKIDKLNQKELSERMKELGEAVGGEHVLLCSAKMKNGLEELRLRLFS